MKVRRGFVSNSSSCSFIVTNADKFEDMINLCKEQYCGDYFIHKGVLYTSYISDSSDLYGDFGDLADEEAYGNPPTDDFDYVELAGILERDAVYIPKDKFTNEELIKLNLVPNDIANRLYYYVKEQTENNIMDVQLDVFFTKCKAIINYEDNED